MSTIRVKVYASTKYVGSRDTRWVEFDKEDWESMSEQERNEVMQDTLFEIIDWGYEAEGESDDD